MADLVGFLVELATNTVGRAFQQNLRVGLVRHRLNSAGEVACRIGPERDLGPVK